MLDADLDLLLDTLREAGALALAMQKAGFAHRKKKDGTFVTDVDEAVDRLLLKRIGAARPADGWLSEESPDSPDRLPKPRLWIADPIDGTRGFLEANAPWCIGMALAIDGEVVLSATYEPADNVMCHAMKGGGSFMNGQRLFTAQKTNVITPKRLKEDLARKGFTPESDSPIPLLLRLASIARGHHGGAISIGNKNDWDIAGGHLILTEAGGVVTDLSGKGMIYNRPEPWQRGLIAAANPAIHAALLELMRTA
ncbi:MAG: 3'(2'),5'-bisphosphate nucleotidase CysQ [Rhizobiales bacterium]|nr:3'(2'),5'-bisphosphate nucleotidase CysQ [Hyphomicrobiales bacterium]